jgi:hypothetical protein
VKCPKCNKPFVPESGDKGKPKEPADGALKLADEPKKAGAKADPPKSAPDPAAAKKPFDPDDDEDAESVKKGYGVIAETEEEKEQAEKNKPKFKDAQEKFKKSARGPAMSLLVMPSNLLTLAGLITCVAGLGLFVWGMWPLVFNDAPPGEEELEEAIMRMMMGICTLFWGAVVCFGASQMQELASYPWAMVGSVMGIFPLLVGIFGIIMLQNPKVKAGFAEGSLIEEDKEKDEDDDDEEGDEADDDDDDGDGGGAESKKRKKGAGKKLAKKGGGDDDEDEDDEDDEDDE